MTPPSQADPYVQTLSLGDFTLQSGNVMPDAYLAYRTYGKKGSPLILYPTWYSGTILEGNEWLVSTKEHSRKALDPEKYFIVVLALFGNGESTSPSNHKLGIDLPKATLYDNVKAQHQLITQHFGYEQIHLVTGWSMGAATSFQWASQYPEMVQRCAPFCGAARVAPHNWIMLQAVKGAIFTDYTNYADGKYKEQPIRGLKALARIYSSWGFSPAFYRRNGFETEFGIKGGLEAVLKEFWEAYFTKKDANNLVYMVWTWEHADIGMQPNYANDAQIKQSQIQDLNRNQQSDESFRKACETIQAKTVIMPCRTDLYFPPEDSQIEQQFMGSSKAKLKVIESDFGHWAGFNIEKDTKFIDDCLYDLLQQ